MSFENCRVLSIQSHVVSGYVGNKSATFPLQVLGFEVDTINSVQFSNHTGYKHISGQVLNNTQLQELYNGLKLNGINVYTHLLTGYVGAESFLNEVCEVVKDLKQVNPNLRYLCDPVLGDNGHMYVPEDLIPVYRDKVLKLADIVTPNQFEAELLTGTKITNEEEALKAAEILHQKGPKTVVLSSTELGDEKNLILLGSTLTGSSRKCVRMVIPRLPATFVGTGDLFACLLLAWMQQTDDLKVSVENTICTMQLVLHRTLKAAREAAEKRGGPGTEPSPVELELRLIHSKKDIEAPDLNSIIHRATEITLEL